MDDVTRRRAAQWTAAGAAAVLAAGSARAQGQARKGHKLFAGSSRNGNIQEALADAIKKAHAAAPGADRQVRWALKEVSGVNGGISPLNTLTVEIEATFA
jgi:hypothetical protein